MKSESGKPERVGPQPGPQTDFLRCNADISVYGGAAGGGKSFSLLLEPLRHVTNNPKFAAIFFRRTTTQITNPGGLWDAATNIYGRLDGVTPRLGSMEWVWKNGGKVKFSHLEHEQSKLNHQGGEYPLLCCQENERIRMADGSLKPVHSIRKGDVVATLQGPRPVLFSGNRRIEDCVRLSVYKQNGDLIGSQIHSLTHKVLTDRGWASYADGVTARPVICLPDNGDIKGLEYSHPYRGTLNRSSEVVEFCISNSQACGKHWVVDLTIASESHYMTECGLVNRNCFDELTHFSESQFWYLVSRNRSMSGVRGYVRATCNPDADSWVATFISWWIGDDGLPIPERAGVLRWMLRVEDSLFWGDSREELVERFRGRVPDDALRPKSVTFIPARLTDNQALMRSDPGYLSNLLSLQKVERGRLLDGNWKVRPSAGLYFQRRWLRPMASTPSYVMWARGWDLAATPKTDTNNPDFTESVLIGRTSDGTYIISDHTSMRGSPSQVESEILRVARQDRNAGIDVMISIPQDPAQAGKPVWEEEPVLLASGRTVALKDIKAGDYVINKHGHPTEVVAVHNQGDLPCVRLSTASGRTVAAALDHPFLTPDGWINAAELKKSSILALLTRPKTTSINERHPFEFRLAGYFIGDGAVGRSARATENGSCHAEFVCADRIQLEDFQQCVSHLGGSVVKRPSRQYQFGTKGLQGWLRETKIAGYTAYDKHVPSWVFGASPENIGYFLGAYFACDGWIAPRGNEVVFYSVSRRLLEEVQHLLLRLGISSTINQKNGKYLETRHVSWLLRLRQQDDAFGRFLNRVPVFHSTKTATLARIVENARFRRFDEDYLPDSIERIEDAGKLPCRCLTVKEGASFTVRDFVVHNSQAAAYTKLLSGYNIRTSPESRQSIAAATGVASKAAKVGRFGPFSAQCEAGNVYFLTTNPHGESWDYNALFDKLEGFPEASKDDAADACSRAFQQLGDNNYDSSLSWVDALSEL